MKRRPEDFGPDGAKRSQAGGRQPPSRLQAILALALSLLILAALGFLGYVLYGQFGSQSQTMGEQAAPEEFVPLTHDELLGRPLSFETPAFIRIPAIGVSEEIREGSDDEEELYRIMSMGPAHLTHTGYPGWDGNCVIRGHRTLLTKPFNRLDEIRPGDSIFIDNPRGTYEYQVQEIFYVDPAKNVSLQTPDPILTVTTCAPEGEYVQRLVVRSSLINYVPIEEMERATPSPS